VLFIYLLYESLGKNIDIIQLRYSDSFRYSAVAFLGLCRDDMIIAV
jgi:hypothetical protein